MIAQTTTDDVVFIVSVKKFHHYLIDLFDIFQVALGMIATATVTSIALVVCIYSIFVGPRN